MFLNYHSSFCIRICSQDIDGSGKLPPIVVVGNKCDLEEQRVVTQAEGEALSKSFGPSSAFMEASAKANIGIDNVSRECSGSGI